MSIQLEASRKLTAIGNGLCETIEIIRDLESNNQLLSQENSELKAEIELLKSKLKGFELRLALAGKPNKTETVVSKPEEPVLIEHGLKAQDLNTVEIKTATETVKVEEVVNHIEETTAAPTITVEQVPATFKDAVLASATESVHIEHDASAAATESVQIEVEGNKTKTKKESIPPKSWASAVKKDEHFDSDAALAAATQRHDNPDIKIIDTRRYLPANNKKKPTGKIYKGFNYADEVITCIENLANSEGKFNYPLDWTCDPDYEEYHSFIKLGGLVHRLEQVFFDSETVEDNGEKQGDMIMLNNGEVSLSDTIKKLFGNMTRDDIFEYKKLGRNEICILTEGAILSLSQTAADDDILRASVLIGSYINLHVNPRFAKKKEGQKKN